MRLEMPALVGEWGALYGTPDTLPAAQLVVTQLEKHLFSDTYWAYGSHREMYGAPYFPVLARPYPAAVAGTLLCYKSHLGNKPEACPTRTFSCVWKEDSSITASSLIYLPEHWFPEGYRVELQPKGDGWSFEPSSDESRASTVADLKNGHRSKDAVLVRERCGYLVIPPTGQDVERRLTIRDVANKLP